MWRLTGLSVLLLLQFGCSSLYGPIAIPEEYSAVPVEIVEEEDVTTELEELNKIPADIYRIMPQDKFDVAVYEHPELSSLAAIVTPDGFISAPLVGPVRVGGLSLVEATQKLRDSYSAYLKNPLVSLIPVYIQGHYFTIIGKVNTPGRYVVTGSNTRITDAIAIAGGLAQGIFNGDSVDLADVENAYIIRGGKRLPVNFKKVLYDGNALHNIPIRSGDYIYVPSVMNSAVYVLGEVRNQTYVGFKEGMTFMKALSFARGLVEGSSSDALVIRGGLERPKLYTINIDLITSGKRADFRLEPNDIIYVHKSGLGSWNTVIRQIVPTLQALSMMAGPFGNPSSFYNND